MCLESVSLGRGLLHTLQTCKEQKHGAGWEGLGWDEELEMGQIIPSFDFTRVRS